MLVLYEMTLKLSRNVGGRVTGVSLRMNYFFFSLFAEILKNKIMQVSLFGIQKTDKYFSELSRDKAFLKFTIFDLWPNTSL